MITFKALPPTVPNGEFSPEPVVVPKKWGSETIYASNDLYCGKILEFDRAGAQFSLHFHKRKDETWYVLDGEFEVHYPDPKTAQIVVYPLTVGQIWRNWPCDVHRLKCLKPGRILEVSTAAAESDNVRVAPGDSQVSADRPFPTQEVRVMDHSKHVKLEFNAAGAFHPVKPLDWMPPDCQDRNSCSKHGWCMYLSCSARVLEKLHQARELVSIDDLEDPAALDRGWLCRLCGHAWNAKFAKTCPQCHTHDIIPKPQIAEVPCYGLTCEDCGHRWHCKEPMAGHLTLRCPHCSAVVTTAAWERRLLVTDDPTHTPAS